MDKRVDNGYRMWMNIDPGIPLLRRLDNGDMHPQSSRSYLHLLDAQLRSYQRIHSIYGYG